MKVLCIEKYWSKTEDAQGDPSPIFHETYNVTNSKYATKSMNGHPIVKGYYYQLEGFDKTSAFYSANFLPLSEIDEMDLVNNNKEVVTT